MKLMILAAAFTSLFGASMAFAQDGTPVHAANRFTWEQAGPDLLTVQAYSYAPREGATMLAALTSVTCEGAASPFACSAQIGARTPGQHSFTLVAIDNSTLTPLESPASNAVTFTFRGPLTAPANLGVSK